MSLLSKLRPLLKFYSGAQKTGALRQMSDHRTLPLVPSRWQWLKFKDLMNFYFLVGAIPCTLLVTWANVFIGPGTLSEIPEDYVPKHWEYYKSPITRFLARYISPNPQQDYEKFLSYIYIEQEKIKLRELEGKILEKMAERDDYQAYYYRPVAAKYHRIMKETADSVRGLVEK